MHKSYKCLSIAIPIVLLDELKQHVATLKKQQSKEVITITLSSFVRSLIEEALK